MVSTSLASRRTNGIPLPLDSLNTADSVRCLRAIGVPADRLVRYHCRCHRKSESYPAKQLDSVQTKTGDPSFLGVIDRQTAAGSAKLFWLVRGNRYQQYRYKNLPPASGIHCRQNEIYPDRLHQRVRSYAVTPSKKDASGKRN